MVEGTVDGSDGPANGHLDSAVWYQRIESRRLIGHPLQQRRRPRDYRFQRPLHLIAASQRARNSPGPLWVKGGHGIDVPGGSVVPQLAAEVVALARFSIVLGAAVLFSDDSRRACGLLRQLHRYQVNFL